MIPVPAQVGGWLAFSGDQARLLASALVVIGFVAVATGVWYAGRPLKARYSSRLTEAFQAGVLAIAVLVSAGVLTAVWGVAGVFDVTVAHLGVDRWTAAQSVLTVVVVVVAYLLMRVINRSIDRLAEEQDAITGHQSEVAYHVADVGVFAVAFVAVLAVWSVSVGNLFIGAGVLGAAIGLAARDTLGAIFAGFVLLFSRPFRVGDWIEVDDHEGVVLDITIVNTKVRTFRDEHVLIPNDEITSSYLVNRSERGRLRVDTEVSVDYDTDLDRATEVAEAAIDDLDEPLSVPSPKVVVARFGDSSIALDLRVWIDKPSARRKWEARAAVIRSVKTAFEQEGIEIPFPQRTLGAREESRVRMGGERSRATEHADEPTPTADEPTPTTDGGE